VKDRAPLEVRRIDEFILRRIEVALEQKLLPILRSLTVACALFCAASCGCHTAQTAPSGTASSKSRPPAAHSTIFAGDILGGPKLIKYVRPLYPDWARRKHLQGTVELTATITKEGSLRDLTLVKVPQDLAPYAEKAVRRWRYEPFKLHGTPVEVKTTILVPFTLSQ
jgi:protein TonB